MVAALASKSRQCRSLGISVLLGVLATACVGTIPFCPRWDSAAAIDKTDFVGDYKVSPDVAAKVKGALAAGAELRALDNVLDGRLRDACGMLAKDLGDAKSYATGEDACNAASAALIAAKAKLGSASLSVTVGAPECRVDLNAYGDCAAGCSGSVQAAGGVQCDGEVKGNTCAGKVKAPAMSEDCRTRCDAHAHANLVCTPPAVSVSVTGTTPVDVTKLKTAIEKDVPAIVALAQGMGADAVRVAGNAQALVTGAGALAGAVKGNLFNGGRLSGCVSTAGAATLSAVDRINANVKAAVKVTATVSVGAGVTGGSSSPAMGGETR